MTDGAILAESLRGLETGVLILGPDFAPAFANPAFAALSGTDARDAIAEHMAAARLGQPVEALKVRSDGTVLTLRGRAIEDGHYLFTIADTTAIHAGETRLRAAQKATVLALAGLAEHKDEATGGHVLRMSRMAYEIARQLRQAGRLDVARPDAFCRHIGLAAILHDVGKVTTPDAILLKPGTLDNAERRIMQMHAEGGASALEKATRLVPDSHVLALGVEIARCHHERWDGTGYPLGLKGAAIPMAARITAVADVYDALISERPYKRPWTNEAAADHIRRSSGSHFDPVVVAAFESVLAERAQTPSMAWEEGFSVGHAGMDRDHQIIIELINQLALPSNRDDPIISELVLDEMIAYAQAHFAREEAYLVEIGFPGSSAHRLRHIAFSLSLAEIRGKFLARPAQGIGAEIHAFLAGWWRDHILVEDMAYARLTGRRRGAG